jgi:PAS domain S-box-containing protein
LKEKEECHNSESQKRILNLEELVQERTSELEIVNKQLIDEIKEHQNTYSELTQILNASIPICVINKEHEIIRINDTYAYFFHTEMENVIGKKCYDIMKYDNCHTPRCTLKRILNGTLMVEYEKRKKFDDGHEIFYLVRATPYRDPDGNIIGIVETYTDITERIRIEQAIIESEERYRLITETAHDLIRVVNNKFKIEYLNEGAHLKTLGYIKDEFIKKVKTKILHPDEIKEGIKFWKQIMKEGEAVREGRFRHKDGHWLWFEIKGKKFIGKDGNEKMLFIARDISERKNYENMLEEFVTKASHQLRTPVSALVQSLNNLNKYNSELNVETKEKLIDVISRNVSRLSELVEDLLNFSEIEDKKRVSPFVDEFMKRTTD